MNVKVFSLHTNSNLTAQTISVCTCIYPRPRLGIQVDQKLFPAIMFILTTILKYSNWPS